MRRPQFIAGTGFFLILLIGLGASSRATSITDGETTLQTLPSPTSTPIPTPVPTLTPNGVVPQPSTEIPVETDKNSANNAAVVPTKDNNPPVSDGFSELMRSVTEDFRQKRLSEALEKIKRAEVLRPNNAEVLNFHGTILAETGQVVEAKKLYESALLLQPNAFWPTFNLAETSFMEGHYEEARKAFEKMAQTFTKPGDLELFQFKILLSYLQDNNDSAAKAELDQMTFPSKTAAYYFANAAWDFHQKSPQSAAAWIDSGIHIFGRTQTDFVYKSLADLKMVPATRPPEGD